MTHWMKTGTVVLTLTLTTATLKRRHQRRFCIQVLTLVMLACGSLSLSPSMRAQDERVTVRVDGRTLFRVGGSGETAASERARRIERRLATLLENPTAITPASIETAGVKEAERIISIAGVPVVTITEADAQDNLTAVDALAAQWAQVVDAALRRARERRSSAWSRFASEVQASVETAFSRLLESVITIIPSVFAATLVVGLFWMIAAGVRFVMRLIFRRFVENITTESLIKQVAYYSVWTLGIVVALDALGFEPQTVVTGLGLTGLALGFALKDILSNFISGILILTLRPFELGDQIVVGETEGSVERIELRATQIRTYDGRVVIVPNAEVFTSRIINNTADPVRRGSVELFIGYDSDLRRAVDVIQRATQAADGVLAEPAASVRIRELGQDDIVVEARFWTDSRRADYVATTSNVRGALVAELKQAGIGLPDPDVRVLVPRAPERWQAALGRADGGKPHA